MCHVITKNGGSWLAAGVSGEGFQGSSTGVEMLVEREGKMLVEEGQGRGWTELEGVWRYGCI